MKFGFTENILLPKYTDEDGVWIPSQKVRRLTSGSLVFGFGSLSGINYETDDSTTQGVTGIVTSSVSWSYYAILDDWAEDNWEWEKNPGNAPSVRIGDDHEVYVVNSDSTYEWKHPSQLKVGDVCYGIGRNKNENNKIKSIATGSTTDIVQLSGITHAFKRQPNSFSMIQPAYLVRTSGSLS